MPAILVAGRLARELVRDVGRSALDLLMPPRCAGCDLPGTLLCDACRAELPLIAREDACPRCGAPDGLHGCAECGRSELAIEGARCAGIFEWPLSRIVTLHKDAGELRLTALMATLAAKAAGEWLDWAHAIVPVPTAPGAVARRGFDHGALLAAELAHVSGTPALDVLRARPRADQRRLTREQRGANARSSLATVPRTCAPARVLVIDDVMTTGATANAAADALRAVGARDVRFVAVARACGGRL